MVRKSIRHDVEDDGEPDAPPASPIAEAFARNLTKNHVSTIVNGLNQLIQAATQRTQTTNTTRVILNYALMGLVVGLLSLLNYYERMPPEALTGFLGTGVGYWLATARRP